MAKLKINGLERIFSGFDGFEEDWIWWLLIIVLILVLFGTFDN